MECLKCRCTIFKPLTDGYVCTNCGKMVFDEITVKPLNIAAKCYITEQKKTGAYMPTVVREANKIRRVTALIDKHYDMIHDMFARGWLLKEVMKELKKHSRDVPGDRYFLKYYRLHHEQQQRERVAA